MVKFFRKGFYISDKNGIAYAYKNKQKIHLYFRRMNKDPVPVGEISLESFVNEWGNVQKTKISIEQFKKEYMPLIKYRRQAAKQMRKYFKKKKKKINESNY